MSEKQRKCSICAGDMLPWDNHQACLKCRNDKKGKDKCVIGKESDCTICAGASKTALPHSQEQGMCAPASQSRPVPSEGELSDEESSLPATKRHRSKSPQGDTDTHSQELDPSYVEMLYAIRNLCLVAPSAFSKKPSKQVVRKQNLALPPVQDIQSMWDYRFRKASGTTVKDKSSSESLSQ